MIERDKFLAETTKVHICNRYCGHDEDSFHGDFSTWNGFGKLWEWTKEQEWLKDFLNIMDAGEYIATENTFTFDLQQEFVNPDIFANAVYEYLKDRR